MKNIIEIIKISKPLHGLVFLIGILILTSSALNLATPLLSKSIVDEITANLGGAPSNIGRVIELVVLTFLASLAGIILGSVSERLGDHFTGKLRKHLTEKFYEKVLTLPQGYFDGQVSGKIINQLNRGIYTIYQFLNGASNFILPTFIQSIFTIIILAIYSLPIAFFTFLLFPVYIGLSYWSTIAWGKAEVEKNKIEDVTRGRLNEVIYNIRLVKGFTNEKKEFDFISNNLSNINKIYAKQSSTFHKFDFARNLSLIIVLFIVNAIVFYNTYIGILTIGEMVLILMLVNMARTPLFAMSYILTQIQEVEQGSREYLEILKLPSSEHYNKKAEIKKIKNASIKFASVSFNYEKSDKVLKDISFEIGKNETVALVGHSGAGKSTIINLILKFYSPTKGAVYLNGKNYKVLDHRFVRNNIALVFQESELFSSTVRENILYGKADATEEEIIGALRLSNAYDFVMKLPQGLDSEIGERGVRLSGGQKQRIQIARAILKNAPILILDEATSSLDAKSEKEVQEGLDNLIKDKLVIVIAHRFSTIQNANKVLVIDEGMIVEQGAPHTLANKPGIYSELLNYQIEGNKKLLEKFDLY